MRSRSIYRPDRPRLLTTLTLAGALALTLGAVSPVATTAQDATVSMVSGELGDYLVGPDGRTLYYFTVDTVPGVTMCDADCQANWPLLTVPDGTAPTGGEGVSGALGAVPLGDGNSVVTHRGRPLYYFAGDAAAGETNGQGRGDVWYVALTDGTVPAPVDAMAPALTLETAESDLGTFLVGKDGLTTYIFTVDTVPGVSACPVGDCLTNWPPVTVAAGETVGAGAGVTGVVGLITGTDGNPQVTYDGRPLYYFFGDTEAGQTNGQGLGEVWWVALADGTVPAPAAAEPVESMAAEPVESPAS